MKADETAGVKQFSFQREKTEQITDKITRQYVHGKNAMLARFLIKKGGIVPLHSHPNEQITYIISGSVKVTIKETVYTVSAGEVLIIPPNVPHMFEALEDTIDIDVFTPPRQDWIEGTETYFKQK